MIPIKDSVPRRSVPFFTWLLILANLLVLLYQNMLHPIELNRFFLLYGFIPANLTNLLGEEFNIDSLVMLRPLLTSLFLHGGWMHLLGNMWILYLFGDNVEKVRVSKSGNTATGTLLFKNGMLATLVFLTQARDRLMYAETNKRVIEIKSDVKEKDPPKAYTDMVEMFRTGKEPRSHDSILYGMAVLEALEKSVKNDKWVTVKM